MALKRGFCTHCKGEETLRIFNVNKDAEICYCPLCTTPMKPKDAISNYHHLISHYLKRASRYLFETTEYLRAYQTFAHIIDLDDSIKVAYFGRILALVHLSSLRKSKIAFANLMHRQQAAKNFHYQENANEYYHFLILLLDALDIYENKMKKRITTHSVFYDVDCVVLYLKRIEEIRAYKEYLISEAQFFIDSNKDQFKEVIDRIKETEGHYKSVLNETFITSDGNRYSFSEYGPNDTPVLTMQPPKNEAAINNPKQMISLYPKDNKKSPIRDDVYQDNYTLYLFVSASVPLAFVLFLGALASVIAGALNNSDIVQMLLFVGAAVLASVSLMLFILHFAWKNALKKKYYNGTNPFIFK